MKTNINKIVKMALQTGIKHPSMAMPGYRGSYDGLARIVPSVGGITYNCFLGDNCIDIVGDHVEAGVSSKNSNDAENNACMTFACVGNQVRVLTGEAKGATGFVVGKHGGCNHVMMAFNEDTINKLVYTDQFMITAWGQGLKFENHEDIKLLSMGPELLENMNIIEENGALKVPVKAIIPAYLMGSGLGSSSSINSDYDIMMHDKAEVERLKLNELCFGDFVYIEDHLNHFGPDYRKNSGSVGVIVHSDSFTSGHGPGVTVLMSAENNKLVPILDENANLKNIMNFEK